VKTFVICNPAAGGKGNREAIAETLKGGLGAVVRMTKRKGDAARLARSAITKGFDYIIAAGGDGTLNEVINGIAANSGKVQVGLLPLGTGNDFARTLELPLTIDDNIDILLSQQTTAIDLVRIKSDRVRYLVNVSAGGFSGLVNEKLTSEVKDTWGPLAYVRSAAAALPEMHAYRANIVIDGAERLSIDLHNVIIANGRFVAGGLPVAPEADPRDGLFDVILIRKCSKPEMVFLAAQMLVGKHLSNDTIIWRRAAKISIRSRPKMCFNTDGELIGNEPAVFQIMPRALHFVVGKK
jgi:diacylglycerol kinase (ATP)